MKRIGQVRATREVDQHSIGIGKAGKAVDVIICDVLAPNPMRLNHPLGAACLQQTALNFVAGQSGVAAFIHPRALVCKQQPVGAQFEWAG